MKLGLVEMLGAWLGNEVGRPEGLIDGRDEGWPDGTADDLKLGSPEGISDGSIDGWEEGRVEMLGDSLG